MSVTGCAMRHPREVDRGELVEGPRIAVTAVGSNPIDATNWCTRLLVLAIGDRGPASGRHPVRPDGHKEWQPPDLSARAPRGNDPRKKPDHRDEIPAMETAHTNPDGDQRLSVAHAR